MLGESSEDEEIVEMSDKEKAILKLNPLESSVP